MPVSRSFLVLSLLVLAACGGSGDVDGGALDAARDGAPRDGAPAIDAGPGADAGDAGALDDGPIGFDAGPLDASGPDLGRRCAEPVSELPPEAFPRCAASTRSCIDACGDQSCRDACASADTTPPFVASATADCSFCLLYEGVRCVDMMGCHAQAAAYQCCIVDHCPDLSCVDTTCATEHAAYTSCESAMAPTCASAPTSGDYAPCFAP